MPKKRGDGIGPYKLLMTLMYGQHKWIEREKGTVRVPCAKLASHFNTSASRIQERLYLLEDWGCLNHVRWNRCWTTLQINPPVGMAYVVDNIECDNNIGDIVDVR